MVLAGTVGKDHALVRRLRTLTFGLLTPFYFIRAGSFVSIPALIAAPSAFVFFLIVKVATKIIGVYPVTKLFGATHVLSTSRNVDKLSHGCPGRTPLPGVRVGGPLQLFPPTGDRRVSASITKRAKS
jgi:hypothetical protein